MTTQKRPLCKIAVSLTQEAREHIAKAREKYGCGSDSELIEFLIWVDAKQSRWDAAVETNLRRDEWGPEQS